MKPSFALISSALTVATLLSGCDLLLLSPTMPGLAPGLGRPLTGRVLDSQTGLPIGKATVMAAWSATNTDNQGNFSLYWDMTGGRSVSLSRAGYTSVTYELGQLADGDTYYIDPIFASSGTLPHRTLNVTALLQTHEGGPLTANGNVSISAGMSSNTNVEGAFALPVDAGFSGTIFSGVLAGGQIAGGPVGSAPFNYESFGYRMIDVPTVPGSSTMTATATVKVQNLPFLDMMVQYDNLASVKAPTIQTDVSLDFGMLGAVPIARGVSSNQPLRVPRVETAKYVVAAKAEGTDGTLRTASSATVTTNASAKVSLPLLAPPKVTAPAASEPNAGSSPTFSWNPVPDAHSYYVEVLENTGAPTAQAKWRGYTTGTSIRYPGFWDNDLNGGILFPQASYSWAVHALRSDSGYARKASDLRADLPKVQPYRQRRFESVTSGMRFSR
ncbi:MAG TPA: carboxypeptidase-like regulatory domain-containing protein [Pantanalinema sp.]